MRTSLVLCAACVAFALSHLLIRSDTTPRAERSLAANHDAESLLASQPIAFVPNLGQWEQPARYVARLGAMTVFLQEKGWTFTLVERTAPNENAPEIGGRAAREPEPTHARGVAVRMTLLGGGETERLPEQVILFD